MSSGISKNKNPFPFEQKIKELNSLEVDKSKYENNTYKFISDTIYILFKYRNSYNSFLNISALLNLILSETNKKILLKTYHSSFSGNSKEKYLLILKLIRSFLENDKNLSNTEKSQCCRIERFLMKLYLKEFLEIL